MPRGGGAPVSGSGSSPQHRAARTHANLHRVRVLQGVGIDGSMAQQKQTVKQAMKDMAKNTLSKSK